MTRWLATKSRYFIIVFVLSSCTGNKTIPIDYSDGNVLCDWNNKLTETIMGDLFTPPVASRIYSYSNLAAYEAMKYSNAGFKSIAICLKEFDSIPYPPLNQQLHFTIASITAFMEVAQKLVYTDTILKNYSNHFLDSVQKGGINKDIIDNSVLFGKKIAVAILKRANEDKFKQTRGMARYSLLKTPGSWAPTVPDYLPAVEPSWRLIRPFYLDTCSTFRPDSILPFSTEKNSAFYKASLEVYEISKSLDSEKVSIARFWDDNPNVTSHFGHLTIMDQKMTPGGHWMAIAANVVKNKMLNQTEASQTFALTALSISDGFIACWDAKFFYSTIRPVSYINNYIDNEWQPFLQTPPFPEFPSGHSTISAAAATVLTYIAGENYAFTDSSEVPFGLPVRSFKSFYQASDEAAMSRLYGGIHFRFANEEGKKLGKKVGNALVEQIQKNETN